MTTKGLLTLHDVAPYVHAGMNLPEYMNWKVEGYPMGGVKYFLKYFTLHVAKMNDFACFFDSKSNRQGLLPGYKGNRIANHAVNSQLDFLYENLLRINVPAYKVDGYEADDLIHSAVEYNRGIHSSIGICSNDYDLTHNVDTQVYFEGVTSVVNNVKWNNFSESVARGKRVLLNTISAHKVFCGDNSDKIPPFTTESGVSGSQLYTRFCDFVNSSLNPFNVRISRDPRILLLFIKSIMEELTPKDVSDIELRIEVVFPRKLETMDFKGANRQEIDLDGLGRMLSYCGEYPGLKLINRYKTGLTQDEAEMFRKRAYELRSGEFAADRLLRIDGPTVDSEVLNMRTF